MSRLKPFSRRLIALWAAVLIGYGALFVLTDPRIMQPRDRQIAIFEDVTSRICRRSETQAIRKTARHFNLTTRAVAVIVRRGYAQGWPPAPCVEE
jgi:hypothetical protein